MKMDEGASVARAHSRAGEYGFGFDRTNSDGPRPAWSRPFFRFRSAYFGISTVSTT